MRADEAAGDGDRSGSVRGVELGGLSILGWVDMAENHSIDATIQSVWRGEIRAR